MSPKCRLIDTLPPSNRTKPMEILALGFSRTGTMSLKLALEKLGYTVYHMSECVTRWQDRHLQLWDEAVQAKLLGKGKAWTGDDLDKILQNYNVVEDIPCILFVDELLERYPDAKVILTNRDVESWEKSVRGSIFKILEWRTLPLIAAIDPLLWRPYLSLLRTITRHWISPSPFPSLSPTSSLSPNSASSQAALRQTYTSHYASIRSKVPPTRLLEFSSQDGWEPLCRFLDKKVPEGEEYPRVNEKEWTVKVHGYIYWLRMGQCVGWYLVGAGVIGVVGVGVGLGFGGGGDKGAVSGWKIWFGWMR